MSGANDEKPRCAATQRGSNIQNGEVSAGAEEQNGTPSSRTRAQDAVLLRFDAIAENSQTLQSLAISLGDAAFRGSDVAIGVHLRQMRLTLISTIGLYKEIVGLSAGEGGSQ